MDSWQKKVLFLILAGVLLYFPIFLRLDTLPFRVWDESRPAVQAYEMARTHNYLTTTYEYTPDMWFTKPPLLIWCQVFFIRLFGYGELAVRLPSALAALGSCIVVGLFMYRQTRSAWWGLIAALVLCTTAGYMGIHGARTGDADVLLSFFLTLSAFALFVYTGNTARKKYLYLFFAGLAAAVLTKGVAGLFLLPGFVIYGLAGGAAVKTLKSPHFYLGLFAFLAVPALFYVLREWENPGYLQAVWDNELLGRYGTTIEGHRQDRLYYLRRINDNNFLPWVCLFPVGLLVGFAGTDEKIKKILKFCLLLIAQYLLLISCSATKTYWYDIPLFPFWAVVIATGIYAVFRILAENTDSSRYRGYNVWPYLFLFMVFCEPYRQMLDKAGKAEEYESFYALSHYLRGASEGRRPDLDGVLIANDAYYGHLLPYYYILADRGQHVRFIHAPEAKPGDLVLVHELPVKQQMDSLFTCDVLDTFQGVTYCRVRSRKEQPAYPAP